MATYTAKQNQNIYDLCLQVYGSLQYMDQLTADNSLAYDAEIIVGQAITYDQTIGILKINEKRETENINYSNGDTFSGYVLGSQNGDIITTDGGLLIEINL